MTMRGDDDDDADADVSRSRGVETSGGDCRRSRSSPTRSRFRSSTATSTSSSSSGGVKNYYRGDDGQSGVAAAAASAAISSSSGSGGRGRHGGGGHQRRGRVRCRPRPPPPGGGGGNGGDEGDGFDRPWRHAASSSLLDTSVAASVSDDEDDDCFHRDSHSTPASSDVSSSGPSRVGGGGANKENECDAAAAATGLDSLPSRTPLRGFPPEADRKRVVGCLAAVLAVLQSHHDGPGEEDDDDEGEFEVDEDHDQSSSSYYPHYEDEKYDAEDGNDDGEGIRAVGEGAAAVAGVVPPVDNRGDADPAAAAARRTTSPSRRGNGGSGTGAGTVVVGSAESMARYRRRRRQRSAALLRRAASLLFLDVSHARALEPILSLRLAPPPDAPPSTRVGDGEEKTGGPAEAESSPSRRGRGVGSDDEPREDDSCADEGSTPPRQRELLFGSPAGPAHSSTPPPGSRLSHGRGLGSLLSSPEDDEGGSESELSPLASLPDAPTQEIRSAGEDVSSSTGLRHGRCGPASSVSPGLVAGGGGDDPEAAAAAASLVETLLGGQQMDGPDPGDGRMADATPAALEGEPSPPGGSRTRSRRSELMDGLMTNGAADYGATETSNPPLSTLFADAPPIMADGDAVGVPAAPHPYREREERTHLGGAPFPSSSREPTSTDVVSDVGGGPHLGGPSGTTYEELIRPFLSQLSPRSGYRCVALLLCHHLLKCPEGYDARVRHAFKALAVVILCNRSSLQGGRRGGPPSDGEEAEAERAMRFWATRGFESLERSVGRRLLSLRSSSSSSSSSGGANVGDDAVERNHVCRSGGCDVVVSDGDANAVVVPAPPPSSHSVATSASARPTKDQILRGIKITSAGLMAGTLFAVTGGLAAPGIAAGIAAVTAGTTAAATAGTTTAAVISTLSTPAAVTALFGVGGGGLVGYKVQRRTRGLTEFEFRRHDPVPASAAAPGSATSVGGRGAARSGVDDGDGEGGIGRHRGAPPEMFTVVCLSGWLTDLSDFDRPWGVTKRPLKKKTRSMAWKRSGPRSKLERGTQSPTINTNQGGESTRGCDEVEIRHEQRYQNAPYSDARLSNIASDSQYTSQSEACLSPPMLNPDDSTRSYHAFCRNDSLPREQRRSHEMKLSHEQHPEEGDVRLHYLRALEQFYHRHNRGNVDRAASILQQWRGEEDDLWALLRDKYGSDPLEEYSVKMESQRHRREEGEHWHHPSPKRGDVDGAEQQVQHDDCSTNKLGSNIADGYHILAREDSTNSATAICSFVGAEEVDDVLNVLFEELGYSSPQDEQHQHQKRVGHSKLREWRNHHDNRNRQKPSSSYGTLTSPPSGGKMPSHPPSSPPDYSSSSHPDNTVIQTRSGGLQRHYQCHTPSHSCRNWGAASMVSTNSSSPVGSPSTLPLSSSGHASPLPGNYGDRTYVASSGCLGGAEAEKGIRTNDDNPAAGDSSTIPPKKNRKKVQWDYSCTYAGELYTVRWESDLLMELCDSVTDLAIDVVGGATTHILKQTALHTLLSAFAWPYALINAANMIDGTWTLAIERSDAAGVELARTLLEGEAGHRPVTLVGFSMGARAIYSCLKELARHQELWEDERGEEMGRRYERRCRHHHQSKAGVGNEAFHLHQDSKVDDEVRARSSYAREPASIVEDAILMGCPNHLSIDSWAACRRVVAGRLVNCYSRRDLILSLMFQYKRVTGIRLRPVCGTCPVDVAGVENYDVSSLISSHGDYCHEVRNILGMVRYGQPRPQAIPIPPHRCDSTFQ